MTDQIHNAMFSRQSSRPHTCSEMFQWLRLANPLKWVTKNSLYDFERTQRDFSICFDPVTQILTKLWLKDCLTLGGIGHTMLA